MTLTLSQQVRLRIQDLPAIADSTHEFDGSASIFSLPQRNLTSGTAFVTTTAGAWTATGATFDTSGFVTFSGIGSAHSAYRVRYVYSTFSDDEIGHFTAVGGSVDGAAKQAVWALMFDGVKRAKWAAPDGTSYSDVEVLEHLRAMLAELEKALESAEVSGGGVVSWAEGQADWT